jgi:hypothetical protein
LCILYESARAQWVCDIYSIVILGTVIAVPLCRHPPHSHRAIIASTADQVIPPLVLLAAGCCSTFTHLLVLVLAHFLKPAFLALLRSVREVLCYETRGLSSEVRRAKGEGIQV